MNSLATRHYTTGHRFEEITSEYIFGLNLKRRSFGISK